MAKIQIITDSGCDLSKEIIDELGIKVLPFTLTLGNETFKEIFDVSKTEMYEKMLQTDEIPKHSQIKPTEFEDAYKEAYEQGYTDIICITINSQGSGTFNNSVFAKNEFFDNNPDAKDKIRIFNVDSTSYTFFYGYPIIEAVKKIRKGTSAEDIVAYLEEWFENCCIYAVPYSLKYAKKSGRISAAAAFAGELLGLKPIILFDEGTTSTTDKIRGEKNIVPKLADIAEKKMVPQTPYIILHGKDDKLAKELEKELHKRTGKKSEAFNSIGCVVSSNIGPDVIGIIIRKKSS